MNAEVSLGGVFVPSLVLLAALSLLLTIAVIRLVSAMGLYRFVAYRPLVDLCLFVLILGLVVFLASFNGNPS